MEKEKVTTRLDAPLRRRLKVYAAAAGLTVEDVVSTAISNYLSAVPPEVELVMAGTGLRGAASGRVPDSLYGLAEGEVYSETEARPRRWNAEAAKPEDPHCKREDR